MGKNNQQRRRMKAKARRAARSESVSPAFGDPWGPTGAGGPGTPPQSLSLDVRASELVSLAIHAMGGKRPHELEALVDQLGQLSSAPGGQRAVVRTLAPHLEDGVTQAWLGGWQPADLHRLAGRELSASAQPLLTDAMAKELSTYAASTLDPRWAAQIKEADARIWWALSESFLESRQRLSGAPWRQVVVDALQVIHLLWGLPRLERLGPLPGTAVPTSTRRPPGAPEVDERILSRVRALLAKAESTTFEAEAETFTAGAQALMARHSIDAALLAASGERSGEAPQGRRIGIDNPYEAPKAMLLAAVADANRCRTVWTKALGFTTVVGYPGDLDAVETLFTSLLVQATQAMTREGSRRDGYGRSRTRAFRQSFLSAFAARIGERLKEVTKSETDAAAKAADSTGGRQLVPLLAARSAAVDEAVEAMFPNLVLHSLGTASDAEGWHSGRRAADRASIGVGTPVEQARAGR